MTAKHDVVTVSFGGQVGPVEYQPQAAMESLLLFSMGSLSQDYGPEPKP